ncbi:MAG: hypothetical protein DWQ02_23435 [Bacteroidetes bacterium]|nr:MAG: hypothetical protein DWQ02_23435 [Bacteroidota bacterium]
MVFFYQRQRLTVDGIRKTASGRRRNDVKREQGFKGKREKWHIERSELRGFLRQGPGTMCARIFDVAFLPTICAKAKP